MKIRLLFVGKVKTAYLKAGVDDYQQRLERFLTVERQFISPQTASQNPEVIRKKESELLLDKCSDDDYIVLLDEQGKPFTSRQFARFLNEQLQYQPKQLTFVIGGAYGVNKAVKQRADRQIQLSNFTLPHELSQLVLMEQLYRGMTIIKGQSYHH